MLFEVCNKRTRLYFRKYFSINKNYICVILKKMDQKGYYEVRGEIKSICGNSSLYKISKKKVNE